MIDFRAVIMLFLMTLLSLVAPQAKADGKRPKEFREAVRLYDDAMYSRAKVLFDELAETASYDDEGRVSLSELHGYSVLCELEMSLPGSDNSFSNYLRNYPHSNLIPSMRFLYAMNLFEDKQYEKAGVQLAKVEPRQVKKSRLTEYYFKKAYCHYEMNEYDEALKNFQKVEDRDFSDYTAPARYSMGYIHYRMRKFPEAIDWFAKASKDGRFKDMSEFYILESHFMMEEYQYVVAAGPKLFEAVEDSRKPLIARFISESYLVLGDTANARKYYDLNDAGLRTRSDWFYSASLLYALEDYKGAIRDFNKMGERKDSIGQVANYHLGYSYIRTKDKVSAMKAFKDAAMQEYDPGIAEDAYFNYAKLAFDLNNDPSEFNAYLEKYPEKERGDRINSYIAVAALYDHDYTGAVEAYDKIDELDEDMVANYMKANYLRAKELIEGGSYRMAIPCLKAAAYYSERSSRFNQLCRFWLAESYFRTDQWLEALDIYVDLYNTSALYNLPEESLIPFNIGYCYFKEPNYQSARKWFVDYLSAPQQTYRKEALERSADCLFILNSYSAAAQEYDKVLKDYFNVNDIYPYYQGGLSYGLAGNQQKKIELLSNVLQASPEAEFYADALYELGRSYALKEDDTNAFKCFSRLSEQVKDSTYVAKAYIEMGSLARNKSQHNEALGYYKTVVEQMPMSGYSDDALFAIESIYQSQGKPEEYLAYIENIGKGGTKTEAEKENMIFNAAEQVFLSGNYQKALVSLQAYQQKYPDGANAYKSDFYVAESYKSLGNRELACDNYKKVIEKGEGSFVELSLLNLAEISYQMGNYGDSFDAYSALEKSSQFEENKFKAIKGMMRSAYNARAWEEVIKNANRLEFDSRADEALKQECEYLKAKSYLASSRREEAYQIFGEMAQNPATDYGAEAAYLIILDTYDRGDFEEVKNKVYAFSDAGTGQMYWLAKSFIVLGDTFVELGEMEQAQATFESVRDGYSPAEGEDDVADNVNMRLKKLEEYKNQN